MYIKSVTVDGFKSYAQQTDIKGFDPLFNAITGLNGSGKSNILDAICFLLGITNLSQVRATNLQDLVYKNGQAGINKATVCITFDNSNKEQSPMGMEAHNEITITRQIVIGGRNKYLINGVNAQNSRVSDLFRSVGLNVNNPHFLIMQGRVTKVMNMKPPEILSMIEEATGTSMYESKKDSAQKMIEKKENKLNQINRTLDEEITPTLQKLHDERSSYLEFQKVQREVERLSRLLIAHQFVSVERIANNASGEIEEMDEEKEKLEQEFHRLQEKYHSMGRDITDLENVLDKDSRAKVELESSLGREEKIEAKVQSNLANQREVINSEKRKLKGLSKSKSECESAIRNKTKALENLRLLCEKAEHESSKMNEEYAAAEKHFQAVTTGLATSDTGEEASWQAQLLQVKKDISQLQTDTKQSEMKLKHNKQELKAKQTELKKTEASYKQDQDGLKKMERSYAEIQKQMDKLNYNEGAEEELKSRKQELSTKIQRMSRLTQGLYNKFPNLQFNYRDPEANWDRARVKGLVANLVDVKDVTHATALEVVAGGRLYNVVVDNHETGAKLLKNGQLKRRCTIIPLNKVAARTINREVVSHAKSLVGQNNVNLALSLVGMDDEIRKALEYVFGGTLVCDTMENANKVAFNPNVKTRTVTLAGELFDPSGTLTGGARPKVTPVFAELKEIKSTMNELHNAKREYASIENKLHDVARVSGRYHDLKNQATIKEREIETVKQRISTTSHGRLLEEIERLQKSIDECSETLDTAKDRFGEMHQHCVELERKIANAPAERERELKEAEMKMNKVGEAAEKAGKLADAKKEELNTMTLEVQELEKEVAECEDQISRVETLINDAQDIYGKIKETVEAAVESVKAAKLELQKHRDHIQAMSHDMQQRTKDRENVLHEVGQCKRKLIDQRNAIEKCHRESNDATNKVASMLEEHDWINNEKSLFGKPSSPYDFNANPPKEATRRLDKLKERQEKLSHSVNMRAMSLLGKAEEKYKELIKKKNIVENDKQKIQRTIEELDQMKNKAVTKAYVQVNKDFGEIFSTLLPGATAKLAPAEGSSVLAGLEFQVGFGDVWKTNLNELSGGQRSLVALSLILAMLLLKPAPIYILDEVDAALDLSHTQNIGGMLREHFKRSQFIVVSLKDGMFNNANVLFRTKFVDGVSTVARFTQSTQSRNPLSALPVTTTDVPNSRKRAKPTQT
uniref:Structural maintenance of chromosomes protein n=1 Tax=Ciona intestinalis TaxID=7719 RepID=F6YYE4_CIOIN|nr:structural maintenance of chromosomes protein 2 [Ciona intestinalis]|eukprot:XP_002119958.1 structural maintenance of chromosomes protein 2 [Ciona intestinalis]